MDSYQDITIPSRGWRPEVEIKIRLGSVLVVLEGRTTDTDVRDHSGRWRQWRDEES